MPATLPRDKRRIVSSAIIFLLLSIATVIRMSYFFRISLLAVLALSFACSGEKQPQTPLETFQTYAKALKKKDYTSAKLLLSNATIQMHEKEAKASGTTVDDIVKRETLIGDAEKVTIKYRNEKVDGEKATLEVQNSFGSWETLPFVKEDGVWKIDKAGYAQNIIQTVEDVPDAVFDINAPNAASSPQP